MYLLKVENGIVFPDHDQFTENSLYTKKSKRFAKDHAYGEEAEIYVQIANSEFQYGFDFVGNHPQPFFDENIMNSLAILINP